MTPHLIELPSDIGGRFGIFQPGGGRHIAICQSNEAGEAALKAIHERMVGPVIAEVQHFIEQAARTASNSERGNRIHNAQDLLTAGLDRVYAIRGRTLSDASLEMQSLIPRALHQKPELQGQATLVVIDKLDVLEPRQSVDDGPFLPPKLEPLDEQVKPDIMRKKLANLRGFSIPHEIQIDNILYGFALPSVALLGGPPFTRSDFQRALEPFFAANRSTVEPILESLNLKDHFGHLGFVTPFMPE